MTEEQASVKHEASLGLFEKYLTLWIAICIVVGLLIGRFLPQFGQFVDSLKFNQLSIPIGILLFFMMYPTVVGIRFSDIRRATQNPKPLLVTIIANWVVAPVLMTVLRKHSSRWKPSVHCRSHTFGLITMHRHGYVVDVSGKRRHGTRLNQHLQSMLC